MLLRRIASRETNHYGKRREERELILRHLSEVEPLLRAACTDAIDAMQPLEAVSHNSPRSEKTPIDVRSELDTGSREPDVPAELAAALERDAGAREAFERLSHSNRKRHVLAVEGEDRGDAPAAAGQDPRRAASATVRGRQRR